MTNPQMPQYQAPAPDYVLTYPAQEPAYQQPTLGRIIMGVFLGNLMTAVVVALFWLIIYSAM